MLINNVYCKKRDQIIEFKNIFLNVRHISLDICGCLSFKTPTMIQGLLETPPPKQTMNLINEEPANWMLTRCLQRFLTLKSNVTVLTYFCFLWLCRGLTSFLWHCLLVIFCLVKMQKHFTFGAKRQQKKKKNQIWLSLSVFVCAGGRLSVEQSHLQ